MDGLIIRPTLVYIIRLWAEPTSDDWVWRVSLQPVRADLQVAPLGFASLETAVTFLQQQMADQMGIYKGDDMSAS
jgi:hypothetical protein